MRGCIEELFKWYNLTVLVMSQRVVRKRRVLSWVTLWAELPPRVLGPQEKQSTHECSPLGVNAFCFLSL